ncbi:hypothetical protein HY410_01555 [Candidatus Gottesmanbacteria bacterium]|nr:hypothetical protein [Candidatus Gottesmanbacteria bacterium]
MKKNEKKLLVIKTPAELQKLMSDISREIESGGAKSATEQNKNTRSHRALRIKLAVIKTIARANQLGGTP